MLNKDLLMCYILIENEIPKQFKFDILNATPNEDRRAEEIKNKAIFSTCYLKDPTSRYYAHLYADLDSKLNKTLEENIYVANINSHYSNLHGMHFETDYIIKERKDQIRRRAFNSRTTLGGVISTYGVLVAILIILLDAT